MVLAYRDPEAESDMAGDESVGAQDEEEDSNDKEERRAHEREVFEKNLRDVGLELELEPSQVSIDQIIQQTNDRLFLLAYLLLIQNIQFIIF